MKSCAPSRMYCILGLGREINNGNAGQHSGEASEGGHDPRATLGLSLGLRRKGLRYPYLETRMVKPAAGRGGRRPLEAKARLAALLLALAVCGSLWGMLADKSRSERPLRSSIVGCEHDLRRHWLQHLPRHYLGRAVLDEAEFLAGQRDHLYRRHCAGRGDVLLCRHGHCVGWRHRERVFGRSLSDRAIILAIPARPKPPHKSFLPPPQRFRSPNVSGDPARRSWLVPADFQVCISREIREIHRTVWFSRHLKPSHHELTFWYCQFHEFALC